MAKAQRKEPVDRTPSQPEVVDHLAVQDRDALINDIVREMRKDSVKEAARAKLNKAGGWRVVAKSLQHPAALLVLGFALTGLVGLRLQQGEWDRQQKRLIEIRKVDLKYTIMDDIIKAVGARNATATAIVEPLLTRVNGTQLRPEEIERFKDWQKAADDWRINSQVLRSRLTAHIRTQAAAQQFEAIVERGKNINIHMNRISEYLRTKNWVGDSESDDIMDELYTEIDETNKNLKQLTAAIVSEADESITSGKP